LLIAAGRIGMVVGWFEVESHWPAEITLFRPERFAL
jgi:hypothetical protein